MKSKKYVLSILKKNSNYIFILILVMLLTSFFTTTQSYVQKEILDNAIAFNINICGFWLISLTLLQLLSAILQNISTVDSYKFSINVIEDFQKILTDKMKTVRYEQLENKDNLDVMSRIQELSSSLSKNILSILDIGSRVVTIIMYIVMLCTVNWYFPIIVFFFTIPYIFVLRKHGFENYQHDTSTSTDSRKLNYLFDVMTSREFAKEVRTFKLLDYLTNLFISIRKYMWNKKKKLLMKHCINTIGLTLLKNVSLFICLLITCSMIIHQETTIGNFVFVITVISEISSNLINVFSSIANFNKQKLYLEDLDTFMMLPDESKSNEEFERCSIEFIDVSFSYPNSPLKALDHLNISIQPGQIVAIVGENGSGKTTFVNLLLGIYRPCAGEVRVGNRNLDQVINCFRKKSVCIFQNFIKYQYSVIDNVAAGNLGDSSEHKNYKEKFGMFYDFVDKLPNKERTVLGQLEDNAVELSGGEWQKLAICRALNRPDTSIFILDEPLSALDPIIETEMYKSFKTICGGKTTILISHRLAATSVCDKIFVFEKGHVVEEGTHKDLIDIKGKYFEMFTAQQKLYI